MPIRLFHIICVTATMLLGAAPTTHATPLSTDALRNGTPITLNFGGGPDTTLINESLVTLRSGGFYWAGRVQGDSLPRAVFVSLEGRTAVGRIGFDDQAYVANVPVVGVPVITQVDTDSLPPFAEPRQILDALFDDGFEADSEKRVVPQRAKGPSSDEPVPVSVMILYTPAAKAQLPEIETLAHLLVVELNFSISSSRSAAGGDVAVQFRLAHMREVDYAESTSGSDILDNLSIYDDVMDDVIVARDIYAADVVMLLTSDNIDVCGIAFQNTGFVDSRDGYGVVNQACALAISGFAHEVGHTMGANHDRFVVDSQDQANALFPFGFGYVDTTKAFQTIMAYNDACDDASVDCTVLPIYSNPEKIIEGAPAGVPEGLPDAADNLKVLSATAPMVAEYRLPRTDIDDGTPDGNQRYWPQTGIDYLLEDADGDGFVGDGRVDMSDFRRWRDWLLLAEGTVSYSSLDGTPSHPKKDVNEDGKTEEPLSESLLPRGDFNGDGYISRNPGDRSIVPGRFDTPVSDLEAFTELYQLDGDPDYPAASLDGLIDSADLTISMVECLSNPAINVVQSQFQRSDAQTLNYLHTSLDPTRVYTAPVGSDYVARVDRFDASGQFIETVARTFSFQSPGDDYYWTPQCVDTPQPTAVIDLTLFASGSAGTTISGGRIDGELVRESRNSCGEDQCNSDIQSRTDPGGIGASQTGFAHVTLPGGYASGSATGEVTANFQVAEDLSNLAAGQVIATLSGNISGSATASLNVDGGCAEDDPQCARRARASASGGGSVRLGSYDLGRAFFPSPTCELTAQATGTVAGYATVDGEQILIPAGGSVELTQLSDCYQLNIGANAYHNLEHSPERNEQGGPAQLSFTWTLRRSQ